MNAREPRGRDFQGMVAVVTGGSGDIGAQTACTLAARGAAVAVVGRNADRTGRVAEGIRRAGGRSLAVTADCTRERELAAARDRVEADLGAVDVLAAFAGGDGMPVATLRETGEHWRSVVDGDLTATFLTVAAFLPGMVERRRGAIVTMASAAARLPARSAAAYAAAKAGVIAFSRHLALEHGPDGIRVNCLAPSAIETERMRRQMPEEARSALARSFPLGRVGAPSDVAEAAVFLVSPASSWITGTTLDVSGGKVMI